MSPAGQGEFQRGWTDELELVRYKVRHIWRWFNSWVTWNDYLKKNIDRLTMVMMFMTTDHGKISNGEKQKDIHSGHLHPKPIKHQTFSFSWRIIHCSDSTRQQNDVMFNWTITTSVDENFHRLLIRWSRVGHLSTSKSTNDTKRCGRRCKKKTNSLVSVQWQLSSIVQWNVFPPVLPLGGRPCASSTITWVMRYLGKGRGGEEGGGREEVGEERRG